MLPGSSLSKFFDTAETAVKQFGMKFRAAETLRGPLEEAGFVNVSCKVLKVPIGTWPKVGTTIDIKDFANKPQRTRNSPSLGCTAGMP